MAEPTAHTEAPGGKHCISAVPDAALSRRNSCGWRLSFVLLYVLMSKIALPRIGAIFAERSKRIARRSEGGA